MAEFASKGVAGAGLGTGIAGLSLGVLNSGLFNGLLNGVNGCCNEDHYVNRYDMNLQREITNKDMEIAYLRGRDAAKTDGLEMYKYIDGRFRGVEAQLAQQAVVNTQVAANLSCMQGNIATLMGLTKTIIPIGNVCPEPMPALNSWTAPTTTT